MTSAPTAPAPHRPTPAGIGGGPAQLPERAGRAYGAVVNSLFTTHLPFYAGNIDDTLAGLAATRAAITTAEAALHRLRDHPADTLTTDATDTMNAAAADVIGDLLDTYGLTATYPTARH